MDILFLMVAKYIKIYSMWKYKIEYGTPQLLF